MQIKMISVTGVFFSLCLMAVVACAEEPATAPAAVADEAGILQTFRDYNDAMAKGDEATMIALQHAATDDQKRFQKAIAANDLAVGKLKAAVAGKFGADAAKQVAKAVGDVGNDDLIRAKVQLHENKAMIAIDGGGIPMIKVDGKWKFDMSDPSMSGSPERIAQQLAGYESRAKNMNAIALAVNEGKITTVDEILKALKNDSL